MHVHICVPEDFQCHFAITLCPCLQSNLLHLRDDNVALARDVLLSKLVEIVDLEAIRYRVLQKKLLEHTAITCLLDEWMNKSLDELVDEQWHNLPFMEAL